MAPTDALSALHERYARSGDAAAMEELVRRTRWPLWRAARRACGEHDAEDAVQAAYQALLRKGPLPEGVPLLGWLLTACVRIAWRRRALARRHVTLADRLALPDDEGRGPARGAERSERARLLREAVARLPARYRDPIVLHHLVGLPVAEVARLMDLPEATVKTRLRRGRALLESRLAPHFAASLFLVPWALADLARQLAVPAGGVMKLKSAAAIGLIALATGAAGFAVGARSPRAQPRRAPPPEEARARAPAEAGEEAPPGPEPAAAPAEPAPAPPRDDETWGTLLAKLAGARGVPPETVQQVKYALWAGNALRLTERNGNPWVDHHLAEFQESMDRVLAAGADGFSGTMAVLETGVVAPILPEMLARACPAGGEAELMRFAADAARTNLSRAQAIEALGGVDAPGVAEFLAQRAREETDAATLLAALDALVRRGGRPDLDRVEAILRDPQWQGYHRRIYELLGSADPDTLVRWARDAEFPSPGSALDALARVDAARARLEAAAILDGPRAQELHAMQRARLRVVAGRW